MNTDPHAEPPLNSSESGAAPADPALAALLERFLEDRESLAEEEYAALRAGMERDPAAAVRLKEQLLLDHLLAERLGIDRARFPEQVAQRLRDLHAGEHDLARQVDAMQRLAAQQVRQYRRPWPLARFARGTALLAALLALAAAFLYFGPRWGSVAELKGLEGEVALTRHGRGRRAELGERLHPGDQLLVPLGGSAKLVYDDGSEFQLAPGSTLRLEQGPLRAKQLALLQGAARAWVAPQPEGAPLLVIAGGAQARVLGTEFQVWSSPKISRLEVTEGRVQWARLARAGGATPQPQEAVVVTAEHWGVAAGDRLALHRSNLPAERGGLIFYFQPEEQPRLLSSANLTGGGYTLRSRGEASLRGDALEFTGGALLAPTEAAEELLRAVRGSHELTLEAVLHTTEGSQQGPARIVSFAAGPEQTNLLLGQEGEMLLLQLRLADPEDAPPRKTYLFPLPRDEPAHVVIAYRPGELRAWLNGRPALHESQSLTGDFSRWQLQPLALGDDWNAAGPWRGRLHTLALYSRAFGDVEAAAAHQRAAPRLK